MILNMYEIFDLVANENGVNARKEILKKNESDTLKNVLQGAFHPGIKFIFPRVPEYTPSDDPPGMAYVNIDEVLQRIYLFVEGSTKASPNLTQDKREKILIEMLEGMEAREAEVVLNMMQKDLKVKYLTKNLVDEVFPGLTH